MSVLQYPEAMNASDLQIWNNAAFDNGESEDTGISKSSWSPLKPILVNRSDSSLDSVSSKENQSPVPRKPLVSVKTPAPVPVPVPVKPLHPNGFIGNSQGKPTRPFPVEKPIPKNRSEESIRDETRIDAEIEEVQMEITRLSSRLEALRLEKAEQKFKMLEKRGRVVAAKFMEQQKQSGKNPDGVKKIEEISSLTGRKNLQRRGFSLGPSEIMSGVKSRQFGKQEIITPVQSIQNRRKSCFWKLQEIDELKVTKERGKSSSVSPKSRKTISKTQPLRQAVTTVGSKKAVKKEDGVVSIIQPKKLFKDGEKSVPNKKPLKPGRVVASRYSQSAAVGNSAMRKRSLPENDKEEGDERGDKKRASSIGSSQGSISEITQNQRTQSRVKKRWEIPNEVVVVHRNLAEDDDETPVSAAKVPEILPRISTRRCANESPRDSGPAKRVVELIGRKSFFCDDEKVEAPVCQALSFAEDVEEK